MNPARTAPVILLFGAGGQVGREVVLRAAAAPDVRLLPLARRDCDITDPAAVAQAVARARPALMINLAAWTAVDRAEAEPDAALRVNRDAVAVLADAARAAGIPLLHLSTDYVFDGSKATPWREQDPVAPLNAYGRSKAEGERVLRERLPEHLVLRTSWVFGAGGGNFVRAILERARRDGKLRVVTDQVGGPTWAGDLAETLLALARRHLLDREALAWGTWHYAGQPAVSWYEFATAIVDEALRYGLLPARPALTGVPSTGFPAPACRPANSRLDMQQTARALGLAPPAWEPGLRRTLSAWAANPPFRP